MMFARSCLKIVAEINLTTISCPNFQLDSSKWVNLRVCVLGYHLRTRLLRAQFPVNVDETLLIERTFPLCFTPAHLFSALNGEKLVIELIEKSDTGANKVLAIFHTDLNDALFGSPHLIKEGETRTDYLSVVLHTTSHCMNGMMGKEDPNLNATLRVKMLRIYNPSAEAARDGGHNLTLGFKSYSSHPKYTSPDKSATTSSVKNYTRERFKSTVEIPSRPCERMLIASPEPRRTVQKQREPFLVRHVDEKLISRTPCAESGTPTLDRGYTLAKTIKSPWHRSTSQLDTVSSLLRRKRPIVRSKEDFTIGQSHCDSDWCNVDLVRYPTASHSLFHKRKSLFQPQDDNNSVHYSSNQSTASSNHSTEDHYVCQQSHRKNRHLSDSCTICRLYQQYFGETYPLHLI